MEKPYDRHSPDRRILGLVNNNNNTYSPTDNLHLLTNVASELADSADRARKLRLLAKSSSKRNSDIKPRKDKSLGILCDKFLAMFPLSLQDDCPSLEICLDIVANQLGIVKRRIYDIINILESLHMTSRVAKNRYEWHGNRHLKPVLSHLKRLAFQYGLDTKIQKVQIQQKSLQSKTTSSSVPFSCGCSDTSHMSSSPLPFDSENFFHDERTLGIMCQKFIMLFLVTDEGSAINLDVATQMLVNAAERPSVSHQPPIDGAPQICSCQPRHKTKVRRLYDIANVLTSLGLIRKERYNVSPVRKPVFVYNGPNIDDDLTEPLDLNGAHTMRNSLLMVPVNEAKESSAYSKIMRLNRKRKDEGTYGPAEKLFCSSSDDSNDTKPARLGSLEDILRVAEQEFNLLMSGASEETSLSLPIASSTDQEFDLSQVKEEQLSDDETIYSGPSSSFDSYDSASTNFSYEVEPTPDFTAVKTEYPSDETVLTEPEPILTEPETVLTEQEAVLTEQEAVLTETETVLTEQETVLTEQETVLTETETVSIEPETISIEPETISIEPETISIEPETISIVAETTDACEDTSFPSADSIPVQAGVFPTETLVPVVDVETTPAAESIAPDAESVIPVGSTVLPTAQIQLEETPLTEVNTGEKRTDQMFNIKVVRGHSRDVTHTIRKIPSFSCGSIASMQSGNDQLAIGKVKRFTVTRKLIPSHFVLHKDPSNNLKLTLHHAPGVKGLIRLGPVASSPKLCLPVTCINTLKTINVVKASPVGAGIPRTVQIKKRLHLVPLNSGNSKGNISVVQ